MRCVLSLLVGLLVLACSSWTSARAQVALPEPDEPPRTIASVAIGLGVGPDLLAAADVSPAQARAMLVDLQAKTTERLAYLTAIDELEAATSAYLEAARGDHSPTPPPELVTLQAAVASLATVLKADLTDSLSPAQQSDLAHATANGNAGLDGEFFLLLDGEADTSELRQALRVEARCVRLGEAVPTDPALSLQAVRGLTSVAMEQGRRSVHLAGLETVFDEFTDILAE